MLRAFRLGSSLLALGLGLLGPAACHSDPTEDPGGMVEDGGVLVYSNDSMPGLVASKLCSHQMACDCYLVAGPVDEDPEQYTLDRCVANRTEELAHFRDGMLSYGLKLDSACIERRLALVERMGCDSYGITDRYTTCEDDCRIFHGDKAAGEPCGEQDDIDDCDQGLRCRVDPYDPQDRRICQPRCLAAGEACEHGQCDYASECSDLERVCEPLPVAGEACTVSGSCERGAVCFDGICAFPGLPGEACPAVGCTYYCDGGICRDAGYLEVCNEDLRLP
ncbi:MAG: hypothetical protein KC731_25195 [Myxococcales bacterium]|nr:hypothetical protein [Myxococcales bacterium]